MFLFVLDAATTWLTHFAESTFPTTHATTMELNPVFVYMSTGGILLVKLGAVVVLTFVWESSRVHFNRYPKTIACGLAVSITLLVLLNISNAVQAIKTYMAATA